MALEVFDRFGNIADNIDPAEVEALPDDRREILIGMLKVARAAEAADDYRIACRKNVSDGMRTHDAAVAADHIANPAITMRSAQLAVINRGKKDWKPEPRKVNKKTRDALAFAITALAEARADLTRADAAFLIADRARSAAVQKWIDAIPKVTQLSLHKEMCAVDFQRRLDIAEGRVEAPAIVKRVLEYPIDEFFAARGTKTRKPYGVL